MMTSAMNYILRTFIRLFFTKEELAAIDKLRELNQHGVEIINQNSGIELQFRDDEAREWYYNKVFGKFKGKL